MLTTKRVAQIINPSCYRASLSPLISHLSPLERWQSQTAMVHLFNVNLDLDIIQIGILSVNVN